MTIVMNLPSAASGAAMTPMPTEAAMPGETVAEIRRDTVHAGRCEAMSGMLRENMAIVPVVGIPVIVKGIGAAKAEIKPIVGSIVRVSGSDIGVRVRGRPEIRRCRACGKDEPDTQ